MIFGNCPYEDCDGIHHLWTPDNMPAFGKHSCETCGREYWLYYSRFEPEAYTLEEFAKKFTVNEVTREITKLPLTP